MTAAHAVLLPGFEGDTLPDWLAYRLRGDLVGVCLYGDNVRSLPQLVALVAQIRAARPDAIIAIDEEGGEVTRLFYDQGSPYPGNAVLGRLDDPALTERLAQAVGWQLRLVGIDLDFAPDADVNSNSRNPVIGTRSFGSDPALVARHTAAWVRGLQSTGVAASVKHFPGHGDTALDSHLALPVVRGDLAALRGRELPPFAAAIAAGARTIMTSHILLSDVDADAPATFSAPILQHLLRDELGFDGVVVSDALDMVGASGEIGIPAAAVRALAAGCDLLCLGTATGEELLDDIAASIRTAVADGTLAAERLADAARRSAALAAESQRMAAAVPVPVGLTLDGGSPVDPVTLQSVIEALEGIVVRVDRRIVVLEDEANIAVGVVPWGPAAAGAVVDTVGLGGVLPPQLGAQPVIVAIAPHRHSWMRTVIEQARAAEPETIVVDMGWPDPADDLADVRTWGPSRAMGEALLAWLERRAS